MWIGLLGALLAAAPAAIAQEVRPGSCPLDGTPLDAPPATSWNTGGGVDSDGCRYAIESDGRWRVVGLRGVAGCGRCGLAFPVDRPLTPLDDPEKAEVRAAVAALPGAGASAWPVAARHEAAAVACRVLGPARLGFTASWQATAFVGELYLRAAWAVRAGAVLARPVVAYRPQDLAEARAALRLLEDRAERAEGGRSRLDAMLEEVERARAGLERVAPADPAGRLVADAALLELMRLEQDLLELKARQAEAGGATAAADGVGEALLDLVRAWMRYGDPAGRDRWLERVRLRGGVRLRSEARHLEAAAAEEARLLGLAAEHLAGAAAEAAGAERARLLFLAGDAERRRGRPDAARPLFEAVRELDPEGLPGRRAAFLLDPDRG